MLILIMSEGQARLRGHLAAARGEPCILKNDPVMVAAMSGLGNREFGRLQRAFSAGWHEGIEVAGNLRIMGCL